MTATHALLMLDALGRHGVFEPHPGVCNVLDLALKRDVICSESLQKIHQADVDCKKVLCISGMM